MKKISRFKTNKNKKLKNQTEQAATASGYSERLPKGFSIKACNKVLKIISRVNAFPLHPTNIINRSLHVKIILSDLLCFLE